MKKSTFAINALAISFIAIFRKQLGHESAHGIPASLVEKRGLNQSYLCKPHLDQ